MQVEHIDRDLANDWAHLECRHCSEYEGDVAADMAKDIARHREAARGEGIRLGLEAAAGAIKEYGDYPRKRRWIPRDEVATAIRAIDPAVIGAG